MRKAVNDKEMQTPQENTARLVGRGVVSGKFPLVFLSVSLNKQKTQRKKHKTHDASSSGLNIISN